MINQSNLKRTSFKFNSTGKLKSFKEKTTKYKTADYKITYYNQKGK